jgi:hypothetical protein
MYPYNDAYAEAFAFAAGYLQTKAFVLSTLTGTISMASRIINVLESPMVIVKVFMHILTFIGYLSYFINLWVEIVGAIIVFFMGWTNKILLFGKGIVLIIVSGYKTLMDFIDYALPPRFAFLFIFFVLVITWLYLTLWTIRIWWRVLRQIRRLSFYVIGKLKGAICFAGQATSQTIRISTRITVSCWIIVMKFTGRVVLYSFLMASLICIC